MSFEYILKCEQLPHSRTYKKVITFFHLLPRYTLSYEDGKSHGFINDSTEDSWGADVEIEEQEKGIFITMHTGNQDFILNNLKKYFLQRSFILKITEL